MFFRCHLLSEIIMVKQLKICQILGLLILIEKRYPGTIAECPLSGRDWVMALIGDLVISPISEGPLTRGRDLVLAFSGYLVINPISKGPRSRQHWVILSVRIVTVQTRYGYAWLIESKIC